MDFKELVLQRRSVNFFKPDIDIDNETLKNIIDLAAMSPSSSNTQPWRIIIVNNTETKKLLRQHAFDQPKITEASATFILLGDTEGYKSDNPTYKSFIEKGYMNDEQLQGFIGMVQKLYSNLQDPAHYALRNAALFGMSLMYAAEHYGWHTHPMIGFVPAGVKNAFSIPDRYVVVMLIAIGKFDDTQQLLDRNVRKSMNDFISFNTFEETDTISFDNMYM